MDATTTRRFVDSNVAWPSDRFFIPDGGLAKFLHENMRFKVFLLMNTLFTDAFATATIPSLTPSYHDEVRHRMQDLIRHMFFTAQIRQNEFRIQYTPTPMPSTSAWMFHVILVLLRVVGFEGDEAMVVTAEAPTHDIPTKGRVAHAQASFLLGAALAAHMDGVRHGEAPLLDYPDYDPKGQMTAHFAARHRPSQLKSIPVCEHGLEHCELAAAIQAWRKGQVFSAPPGIHVRIKPRAAVDEAAVGVKVASAAAVAAAACLVEVGAGGRPSQGGVKRTTPRRSKHLATSGSSVTSSGSSAAAREHIFIKEEERASSSLSQSSGGVHLMVDTAITELGMVKLAVESGGESSDSMLGLQTVSDSSEFPSD